MFGAPAAILWGQDSLRIDFAFEAIKECGAGFSGTGLRVGSARPRCVDGHASPQDAFFGREQGRASLVAKDPLPQDPSDMPSARPIRHS
jgi:hypothetical protein